MRKRIRLGLIFSVDENWIGGSYYILNLISALATLPDKKQPVITILSKRESDLEAAKQTGYKHLKYHNPYGFKQNIVERIINKLSRTFLKGNIIDKRISPKQIDILFPARNENYFNVIKRKIYWFADFQHIVYPDFFTKAEIDVRNIFINQIATSGQYLVLSSRAAKKDWDSLHIDKNCKVEVIPFAVTHPPISNININELLEEFQINKNYFIVSNQFWIHKNHFVVLKAAKALKHEGFPIQFVFTGKEDDYRNPGYFQSIVDFINEHDLNGIVKMLGLIDRRKQLKLMQHSKAVIQPSLFEGWSTVVEDAKSLGKTVIASDIPVHKEQLQSDAYFFEPHNDTELTEKIKLCLSSTPTVVPIHYEKNIALFGDLFFQMLERNAFKV